ncbi:MULTISPECIES: DUF3302 domain-containing protein [Sphingobacterium]|uniref:DUF3302 domain-containing protein n=1 Tax=Sphingobacterium TaxID=28453 RepID=UPI00257C96D6|nr:MULTISPECIES: DUF3302 domain-containing protein [Sphingobacterium]
MQKLLATLPLLLFCGVSHASTGGAEDAIADVASWLIIFILPLAGIFLFWKVHIYPEKVAEKKNHPQLSAIKSMCLLSLIFGGLLWPVALIWANYNYKKDNTSSSDLEETDSSSAKNEESAEDKK